MTNPGDPEAAMEQILKPLGKATEAAGDALYLHAGSDELSPAVAEIIAREVHATYGAAHEELVAVARRTAGRSNG